jgi:hypothetical protein
MAPFRFGTEAPVVSDPSSDAFRNGDADGAGGSRRVSAVSSSTKHSEPPHSARRREASLLGRRIGSDQWKRKDLNIMANIDHKQGTYSIPANSSQQFTFWWGRDSKAPNEFFDVSISPHFDKNHSAMEPLQETNRAVSWDSRGGVGVVLTLTLQNRNSFPVTFEANHVRIY